MTAISRTKTSSIRPWLVTCLAVLMIAAMLIATGVIELPAPRRVDWARYMHADMPRHLRDLDQAPYELVIGGNQIAGEPEEAIVREGKLYLLHFTKTRVMGLLGAGQYRRWYPEDIASLATQRPDLALLLPCPQCPDGGVKWLAERSESTEVLNETRRTTR